MLSLCLNVRPDPGYLARHLGVAVVGVVEIADETEKQAYRRQVDPAADGRPGLPPNSETKERV